MPRSADAGRRPKCCVANTFTSAKARLHGEERQMHLIGAVGYKSWLAQYMGACKSLRFCCARGWEGPRLSQPFALRCSQAGPPSKTGHQAHHSAGPTAGGGPRLPPAAWASWARNAEAASSCRRSDDELPPRLPPSALLEEARLRLTVGTSRSSSQQRLMGDEARWRIARETSLQSSAGRFMGGGGHKAGVPDCRKRRKPLCVAPSARWPTHSARSSGRMSSLSSLPLIAVP
jgi:hypothetical protein